jgi:hypothetical protein
MCSTAIAASASGRTRKRRAIAVCSSVVSRHDLDVERVIASVGVVLDAHVWELDVPRLVAWQVVFPWRRPSRAVGLPRRDRASSASATMSA